MNAERLLQHYEMIADAPDAIARLRRFVLDLAVRGKLVPQDPEDEPASVLLERIAQEKARTLKSKKSGANAGLKPQICINLPSSWVLATFNDISLRLHYGFTASADSKLTNVRLLRITDIQGGRVEWDSVPGCVIDHDALPNYLLEAGDILIARTGGTIGKTFLVAEMPVKSVFASYLIRLQPARSLLDRYVKLFCETSTYWEQLTAGSRGAGQPNVNGQTLGEMRIPIPPLAEQHRLVAKVDELMALCDQLEAARTARETTRDRLAAASLARLNSPDPETFRDDARFAMDTLPALTARPDRIKRLRQTILNLAVRGKLVPQDPTDEPAEELLRRIAGTRAEKARKAGVRRNGLPDASLRREEGLEPHNWVWTQLGEVALSMRYGTSVKCDYGTKGAPVLRIPNVSGGRVSLDDIKFGPLSPSEIEDLGLLKGDILLIRSNGSLEIVGRAAVVTSEAVGMSFAGYLVRLRTDLTIINPAYIWLALQSSGVRDQVEQPIRSAVGLKNVNLTEFGALTFCLPPFAEQHRIVAKVDELMALCDQLEASLVTADETRRKLLDALLAEALAPVNANDLRKRPNE